jgi:hypothetical protein
MGLEGQGQVGIQVQADQQLASQELALEAAQGA